jgi:hypothetical protein
VTIAVNTAVCFVMFTIVHDASHYSISRTRWVNSVFGRLAMLFVSGTVEMDHNFALSAADFEAGYVLTCQSHPTSPTVAVDYDA